MLVVLPEILPQTTSHVVVVQIHIPFIFGALIKFVSIAPTLGATCAEASTHFAIPHAVTNSISVAIVK
ncbi:MAG: hypothetical protein EBU31_00905 [Proteobacteria bacterium]|nr:hypothetical protein [Pseudomonadota bacterium]